MKLRKTFWAVFLFVMMACMQAAAGFASVICDVTDLSVNGQTAVLKAVIRSDDALKAGGFAVTFPSDRLAFSGASASVEGVIVQASASGNTLTAGYMMTVNTIKYLELAFTFRVTGAGPYIMAVNSASMRDDVAGLPSRPAIYGDSDSPVMWSVPDSTANLFVYIPHLSRIVNVAMTVDGNDILTSLLDVSSWYVDPVKDIAYLVLPGVALPVGSYEVNLNVEYGNGSDVSTADVVVQ